MAAVYRQALGISSNDGYKSPSVHKIVACLAGNKLFNRQNQDELTCHAGGGSSVAGGDSSSKVFHFVKRSNEDFNGKIITSRMRTVAQRTAACAAVPMKYLIGDRRRNSFGILMYHRIAPHIPGIPVPTWNVTPERFRDQMRGLLARGYHPWPLRKAVEYHRKGLQIPPNTFVVTFDDGYECIYTNARPILKELRIPATMFVVTGLMDTDGPMPCEDWSAAGSHLVPASAWRCMSIDQCREILADGLIDLGAHTHWHEDYRGRPHAFPQRYNRVDPGHATIVRRQGDCLCISLRLRGLRIDSGCEKHRSNLHFNHKKRIN